MKSALSIGFLVFVIVVGAATGGLWYFQSNSAKYAVVSAIEVINRNNTYITYDAIETSGFPEKLVVSIVNPTFKGRVDSLISDFDPAADVPVAWDEHFMLNGSIDISVNALSNEYSITFPEIMESNHTIGDAVGALYIQTSGQSSCDIALNVGNALLDSMWSFDSAGAASDFDNIKSIQCALAPTRYTDKTTSETLYTSSETRFALSNNKEDDNLNIALYAKATAMKFTEAGDAFFVRYLNFLQPNANSQLNYAMVGEQNMEIDISYLGPAEANVLVSEQPISVSVNSFKVSSDIASTSVVAAFNTSVEGDQRNGRIKFDHTSSFAKGYNEYMNHYAQQQVNAMYHTPEFSQSLKAQEIATKYTPEELYTAITPAVPDFESLGTITQQFDITYDGKNDFSEGNAVLDNLVLSASPYGISAKGDAALKSGQLFPDANVNVTCKNCTNMIDDMYVYVEKLRAVISTLELNTTPLPEAQPAMVEGAKSFLTELAQGAAQNEQSGTFNYKIISSAASGVTVNDKPLMEVMQLYTKYISPPVNVNEETAPAETLAPATPEVPDYD